MAVFLCIAELWQPTFISSPVCDIVGDAQRAYRYGDSAKCCAEKTLFAGPGRGVFYELRVTRSDVVSLSVPLRAEGFPKRRCQLESVAAERRI